MSTIPAELQQRFLKATGPFLFQVHTPELDKQITCALNQVLADIRAEGLDLGIPVAPSMTLSAAIVRVHDEITIYLEPVPRTTDNA